MIRLGNVDPTQNRCFPPLSGETLSTEGEEEFYVATKKKYEYYLLTPSDRPVSP